MDHVGQHNRESRDYTSYDEIVRIFISAFGTRGDYQPVVALGRALQERGHSVDVSATPESIAMLSEHGLGCLPIDTGDSSSILDEHPELLEAWCSPDLASQRKALSGLMNHSNPAIAATLDLASRGGYDLFIAGALTQHTMVDLAAATKTPLVALAFAPAWPHRDPAATIMDPWWWRPDYMIEMVRWMGLHQRLKRELRRIRQFRWRDRLAAARLTVRVPIALAVSPLVCPATSCVGLGPVKVTGFLHLRSSSDARLPGPVEDFLTGGGGPPVFLSFGSATTPAAASAAQLILDEVRCAGGRAIIDSRFGIPPEHDVFVADSLPHDLLFPRCAAIVHHGGSGTTGTALASGRPQWIVPMAADQPYFGRRVHALGVGPAPVHLTQVTRADIRASLAWCATSRAERRAADVGVQIRSEPAIEKSIGVIEAAAGLGTSLG